MIELINLTVSDVCKKYITRSVEERALSQTVKIALFMKSQFSSLYLLNSVQFFVFTLKCYIFFSKKSIISAIQTDSAITKQMLISHICVTVIGLGTREKLSLLYHWFRSIRRFNR